MKRDTKILLERAANVAHLIGNTIESTEELTSTGVLDLDVAIADLRQLVNDAHHAEYGL